MDQGKGKTYDSEMVGDRNHPLVRRNWYHICIIYEHLLVVSHIIHKNHWFIIPTNDKKMSFATEDIFMDVVSTTHRVPISWLITFNTPDAVDSLPGPFIICGDIDENGNWYGIDSDGGIWLIVLYDSEMVAQTILSMV